MTPSKYEQALIIKAAKRWQTQRNAAKTKAEIAAAEAELRAFGQVASDIFDMCLTPFGFDMAIREATAAHPLQVPTAATADRAAQVRAAWEALITTDVLVRLH